MSSTEAPCACGKGTVTTTVRMDDWHRTEHSHEIHCPQCKAQQEEVLQERRSNNKARDELNGLIVSLATERYLQRWLDLFEGKSRKSAWMIYTGGHAYPSLATFYKHVREQGLPQYLTWCFRNDVQKALGILNITDAEIEALLQKRDRIPSHREPHPYQ